MAFTKGFFLNCDFRGSSFDKCSYTKTEFTNCKGIDKQKMFKHSKAVWGTKSTKLEDIIVNNTGYNNVYKK